ncbi:YtxH domain-containing protein, partial [Aerococcus urinae]|uniref:YtxH domain-containing protein n=1 Tax=Aerococcus urinae TaxID=1376 RepID=UPI00254C4243
MSNKTGAFLLGAIIGGSAAAVTALLFAPKSGKELRQDINDQANNLKDTAMNYADLAIEKGNTIYEATSDAANDIRV